MQPGNQFRSGKSTDRDQQLALTTSAKSRSCSLGINSAQASQPMEISNSHLRPLPKVGQAAWESIQLRQVIRWRSAIRVDDLSQKQVMQPGNQFSLGKSADGDQQFALTTSAKIRSGSLGINSAQASHPMEISNSD